MPLPAGGCPDVQVTAVAHPSKGEALNSKKMGDLVKKGLRMAEVRALQASKRASFACVRASPLRPNPLPCPLWVRLSQEGVLKRWGGLLGRAQCLRWVGV